jgi:hypothetical protein
MPVAIAWTEGNTGKRDTFLTWEGGVVERFVRNDSSKVTKILSFPDDFTRSPVTFEVRELTCCELWSY